MGRPPTLTPGTDDEWQAGTGLDERVAAAGGHTHTQEHPAKKQFPVCLSCEQVAYEAVHVENGRRCHEGVSPLAARQGQRVARRGLATATQVQSKPF